MSLWLQNLYIHTDAPDINMLFFGGGGGGVYQISASPLIFSLTTDDGYFLLESMDISRNT